MLWLQDTCISVRHYLPTFKILLKTKNTKTAERMSFKTRLFLRHFCSKKWKRQYNIAAADLAEKDVSDEQIQPFRTLESNPVNHNSKHMNRFYTIPQNVYESIFQHGGIPKRYQKQVGTFNECSLLVRKSTLELISYLKQTDYSRPINKYVLHGIFGTGKTLILAHILHYAYMSKQIIVHVSETGSWFRFPKEVANSSNTSGVIDLPVDAGLWLIKFKCQNNPLLSELDLKVSKDYEWTQREKTPRGAPLSELVDFGINRIRFATNVIEILMQELKNASIAGKCKILVAIDNYNAFWSDTTDIRNDNKQKISPKDISLTRIFVNMTKADWCNGAAVLVTDISSSRERRDSTLPIYLLGKEGFEFIDPFLPIHVSNYTRDEFDCVMEYLKERKWVRNITTAGLEELWVTSSGNPSELHELCKGL